MSTASGASATGRKGYDAPSRSVSFGLDWMPYRCCIFTGPISLIFADDLLDTLTRLREEGKIRNLSVNSFDMDVIEHFMTIPVFGTAMIDYNILRPEPEPVIAKLAARNFGILAEMALGGGLYPQE
jgi:aryl-alcohol dehydrogenase-like predicted oxidoreductase